MNNPAKTVVMNLVVNIRLKMFHKYERSYDFFEEIKNQGGPLITGRYIKSKIEALSALKKSELAIVSLSFYIEKKNKIRERLQHEWCVLRQQIFEITGEMP